MFPTLPRTWNQTKFNYSPVYQMMEMVFLTTVSFLTPVVLMHPQLLVGVVVNAMLVRGVVSLKGYRILPLIIMPSLGAVTAGVLLGSLTKFLIYFVPLIWVGNTLLVHLFKRHMHSNYLKVLISAALVKAGFLFSGAFILYSFSIVPVIFLSVMGYLQFITAFLGGALVYGELQVEKRWFLKK